MTLCIRIGKNRMDKTNIGRYWKQIMLDEIGFDGQMKMGEAKVAVIGAGGLGSPILQYLNAVGIGTIGVVDFDTVQESNLHRQILFNAKDLGQNKVDASVDKLELQNTATQFHRHLLKLNKINAYNLLADYDLVVDGCDNFETRYIVNDACVELGKPLVYGSILAFEGQIATFNFKGSKNLRHLFPEPPDPEDVPSCSENGVLGTFPGIIGTIMAQEAIKIILELHVMQDELLLINTKCWEMTKIRF